VRVLLISNLFPPGFVGGYELMAADFADALVALGHSVTVLSSPAFDQTAPEEIRFPVLRTLKRCIATDEALSSDEWTIASCFGTADNLNALANAVAEHRPDNVLIFSISGIGALGIYAYLDDLAFRPVSIFGDNFFSGVRNSGEIYAAHADRSSIDRILSGASAFFLSRRVRAEIEAELGLRFMAPRYIPAGVPLAAASARSSADVRSENDGLRFVFASRLQEHKGIQIVLDAVELARDAAIGKFHVDLFGPGDVGIWMGEVERRGLDGFVRYAGVVSKPEMLARYAEYDALLLPTWEREAFGAVAAEAAVAGCLPIMTGAIGAAEWMVAGLDCIKIRRTASALASAMGEVARSTPAERRDCRSRVSRSARRMFDFDRWTPLVERALRDGVRPSGRSLPKIHSGASIA